MLPNLGYFYDYSKEQTIMLKVFPDNDHRSTAHDYKKIESLQRYDWTMWWELAKRITKGIGKLARNMPGDRRRKTVRLAGDSEGSERGGRLPDGETDIGCKGDEIAEEENVEDVMAKEVRERRVSEATLDQSMTPLPMEPLVRTPLPTEAIN
ncbi:hypothetical protein BHM03_00009272 [Ensete ventricosum]|nr:hypothetical protein BHM03_00009272 [Ensete ventricosum]